MWMAEVASVPAAPPIEATSTGSSKPMAGVMRLGVCLGHTSWTNTISAATASTAGTAEPSICEVRSPTKLDIHRTASVRNRPSSPPVIPTPAARASRAAILGVFFFQTRIAAMVRASAAMLVLITPPPTVAGVAACATSALVIDVPPYRSDGQPDQQGDQARQQEPARALHDPRDCVQRHRGRDGDQVAVRSADRLQNQLVAGHPRGRGDVGLEIGQPGWWCAPQRLLG